VSEPQAGAWDRWGRSVTVGLVLLVAGFNVVTWLASQGRRQPELPLGSAAPALRLPRLGGGTTAVGPVPGSAVVLEFWATWCPPCKRTLPELQALAGRTRGRPVRFVLVNQDESSQTRVEDVRELLEALDVRLPVALDDGRAARAYRVERLPYAVVLDAAGRVAGRWTGEWDEAALARLLDDLVVKGVWAGPPETARTSP